MVACLTESGWDAELKSDGTGFDVSIPASQSAAFEAAVDDCHERTGAAEPAEPPDQAAAEAYYDDLLGTYECLGENGFSAVEPSSQQAFVDAYMTGAPDIWMPYPDVDPEATRDMTAACPEP